MAHLFKAHLGSTSRKLLALRLADFADDDGKGIWPTVGRLARETELSERTVQRILAEFVDEGLLMIRSKGGSKPGEATRYDFSMAAIGKLKSSKEAIDGCHIVTHDTVSPATSAATTGDTDDVDGCHHVTQTVIEPPVEPSESREAREAVSEEDTNETAQTIERAYFGLIKSWPRLKGMPKRKTWSAWLRLAPAERREAVAAFPRWLELLKANGKDLTPGPFSYFSEKLWTELPALEEAAKPTTAMAAPFGKLWVANLLAELLQPPSGRVTPPTAVELMMIDQGKTTREAVMAEKRMRHGWPAVNAMYERARERRGVVAPLALEAAAHDFHQFHRDSAAMGAWRALFVRMGWLFYGGPLPEWIWLPPMVTADQGGTDAEAALNHFRHQISAYLATRSRGNDDAA